MRTNFIEMFSNIAVEAKHLKPFGKVIISQPVENFIILYLFAMRGAIFCNMVNGKKLNVFVSTTHTERHSAAIVAQNEQAHLFTLVCYSFSYLCSVFLVKDACCFSCLISIGGILVLSLLNEFI